MPTFYENKRIPIAAYEGVRLVDTPHLHDHLEVVFLRQGATGAACETFQGEMEPGDIFISFPNQVHYYPKIGDETAIHSIIIFSPMVCSEFKDMFRRMVPLSPIVRGRDLDPDISELISKIVEENHKETPYAEATTRGYLIAFLGKLFRSMEFREEKKTDGSLLNSILNYCGRHYTEPLSLEILSKELNAGKYHISHIFSEKLKISFSDYINGLRINDAIRQLTSDPNSSITDICYECGFNSTRTFNRAFLKYTGTTPREYREQNLYKDVKPINFYIKD